MNSSSRCVRRRRSSEKKCVSSFFLFARPSLTFVTPQVTLSRRTTLSSRPPWLKHDVSNWILITCSSLHAINPTIIFPQWAGKVLRDLRVTPAAWNQLINNTFVLPCKCNGTWQPWQATLSHQKIGAHYGRSRGGRGGGLLTIVTNEWVSLRTESNAT